ncbi:MAG: hypothetical protein ACO3FQ_01865 [Terrimicrobiaceae bacterium]
MSPHLKNGVSPKRLGMHQLTGQCLAIGTLFLMARSAKFQPVWRWIVFPDATIVPALALYGALVPFLGLARAIRSARRHLRSRDHNDLGALSEKTPTRLENDLARRLQDFFKN